MFFDQLANHYVGMVQVGQPQQLEQFRMIVLEEQLVEKLKNALKSKKKVIKFSELANK